MATSFSPNEERFGFRAHGFFRCKLPSYLEFMLVFLITVGMLSVFSLILSALRSLPVLSAYASGIFTGLLTFAIFAILAFIWRVLIGLVFLGIEHKYTADSEKITIQSGAPRSEPVSIRYSDVRYTSFEPITLLGISRGFFVTIATDTKTYKFEYSHGFKRNYLPDITKCQLYIIEERSSALKKQPVQTKMEIDNNDSPFLFE